MYRKQLEDIESSVDQSRRDIGRFEDDYKIKGKFRLLFTFGERVAETVLYHRAAELVRQSPLDVITVLLTPEADRSSDEQDFFNAAVYLTMRADFNDAGEIKIDDPSVIAALDFYVSMGILTESRKDEIINST